MYDGIREADGGDDERGVRPQNGMKILEAEMSGLAKRGGEEAAQDNVTDVGLDPTEVRAARQVEIEYFRQAPRARLVCQMRR